MQVHCWAESIERVNNYKHAVFAYDLASMTLADAVNAAWRCYNSGHLANGPQSCVQGYWLLREEKLFDLTCCVVPRNAWLLGSTIWAPTASNVLTKWLQQNKSLTGVLHAPNPENGADLSRGQVSTQAESADTTDCLPWNSSIPILMNSLKIIIPLHFIS